MKQILVMAALLGATASAGAFELAFRTPCQLEQATDAMLVVTVLTGQTRCEHLPCFANHYTARVWGDSLDRLDPASSNRTSFVSQGQIEVGNTYVLFVRMVRPGETTTHVESTAGPMDVPFPEGTQYIAPFDGAFLKAGTRYYRSLMVDCYGDGSDCKALHERADPNLLTAMVLYPGFAEEIATCARDEPSPPSP